MAVPAVRVHYAEFDGVMRFKFCLLPIGRFGLQGGIVNEQNAAPIGRPAWTMAVTVIRERFCVRSGGTHRIDVRDRPRIASIRRVRVSNGSGALLLGQGDKREGSGDPQFHECEHSVYDAVCVRLVPAKAA